MVKDKINFRARGPNEMMTRQPVGGRANDGGLRIGIMEADSINAHGMVSFLTESMMERGDKYYMAVCNKTGLIAVYNPAKKIFLSPMVDGLHMTTTLDGKNYQIHPMTKYGRDFSVVCIPYSLKLLMQELQTMNIVFRVITEDNIGQIDNMSYSSNMVQLLGLGTSTEYDKETIMKQIQSEILFRDRKIPNAPMHIMHIDHQRELHEIQPVSPSSPPYAPTSPAYMPTEEELENMVGRTSPAYMPTEEDGSSPYIPYADGSPAYVPDGDGSPTYVPASPAYIPSEEELENMEGRTSPAYAPLSGTEQNIQVGDNVTIRGGGRNRHHPLTNPIPTYKVTDKIGTDHIVIENPEDGDVRVVSPHEIVKSPTTQMNPYPIQTPYENGSVANHAILHDDGFHHGEQQTPSIIFKPTINVVNGSENQLSQPSVEPIPTEGLHPMSQNQSTMMPISSSVQVKKIGFMEPIPTTKDIMVKSNSNEDIPQDEGATDLFDKIVVKKLG
jgi:hypothetical protein